MISNLSRAAGAVIIAYLLFAAPLPAHAEGASAASQATADAEMLKDFQEKAARGDVNGQWLLGDAYSAGSLGLTKSYEEAARLYQLAAGQNSAEGAMRLSDLFSKGHGVQKDDVEAAKWMAKAARWESACCLGAKYMLAAMYEDGVGVGQDYVEATFWRSLQHEINTRNSLPISPLSKAKLQSDQEHLTEDQIEAVNARVEKFITLRFYQ